MNICGCILPGPCAACAPRQIASTQPAPWPTTTITSPPPSALPQPTADELTTAIETFRDAWLNADAQGASGHRIEAGLRATLLPVIRERDELRNKIDAIRDAFERPGPAPFIHAGARRWLRTHWAQLNLAIRRAIR